MADELGLPGIPEASPDDPEDVSWALSTAEAMWARGDHLEGIKWVRRAAEAASEAERDERALALAKVAADLSSMLTRRSGAASNEVEASAAPVPAANPIAGSVKPAPPLPSKIGQAKTAGAPRPGAGAVRSPAAPKPVDAKKSKRRSRENLENEARAAALMSGTSPSLGSPQADAPVGPSAGFAGPQSVTNPGTPPVHVPDDTAQVPVLERPIESARVNRAAPPAEPSREELTSSDLGSAEYWDASPTQNLTSDEIGALSRDHTRENRIAEGDRSTVIGAPPSVDPVKPGSIRPPPPRAASQDRGSMRPPATTQHDPAIKTSQAVRVVVWRDASGVHLAPEGSAKIAALTIDAVLVALDPSADLTAWLSRE